MLRVLGASNLNEHCRTRRLLHVNSRTYSPRAMAVLFRIYEGIPIASIH